MTSQVLILCTGNSCRSILAEALFNHFGQGRVTAHSAGSRPAGAVNPHALACLERNGVPMPEPRSKSWDEFTETPLDAVITVCDSAAGESCPVWFGSPARAHWGLPDPADATGTDDEIAAVFQQTFDDLQALIRGALADWPEKSANPAALTTVLELAYAARNP